jgi:hypothetical protein
MTAASYRVSCFNDAVISWILRTVLGRERNRRSLSAGLDAQIGLLDMLIIEEFVPQVF